MNQKISFLKLEIIVIISCLLYSCDPADNRLRIVNQSNTDIYFFYSCDSALNDLNLFRSGYYQNSKGDSSYILSDHLIKKGSFRNIPNRGFNAWTNYVKDCNEGKMHLFFFTDSIVRKYSYDEIKAKKLFERHLIYTADKLKKNNWTVTYP